MAATPSLSAQYARVNTPLALILGPEQAQPSLHAALAGLGLHVISDKDERQAIQQLASDLAELVVVSITGEDQDPVGLCRRIRTCSDVPILLALSASAGRSDIIQGLDAGADGYIVAPFHNGLVAALCKSLLRRSRSRPMQSESIGVRDLKIDLRRCEVLVRGETVGLTPTEFRLLSCLAANAGKVVSSCRLVTEASGYECDQRGAQAIVKVHMRRLRRKLKQRLGTQPYIVNVRGFGYLLEHRDSPRSDKPSLQ